MKAVLGIDTSNYTTSAALLDETGRMLQKKRLLDVKPGELGLRQSDALFQHTLRLPEILEGLFSSFEGEISAVAVSDRPRNAEGSYMPCFLAGVNAASAAACSCAVPLYRFSHQQGHIAAAVWSAKDPSLLTRPHYALHLSGGTTDLLLVTPSEDELITCELIASSLDLKAGQAVDRVGKLLGLTFPAGKELERLSLGWEDDISLRPSMKDGNCSLSGIQNHAERLLKEGHPPEYIAKYCLAAIYAAVEGMIRYAFSERGELPVVFAGGVMSNRYLQKKLSALGQTYFAEPEFSADNAAGIAYLGAIRSGLPEP
ncbi:MAG: peptidase M22 [Ruminococcaceae bacterium]|nr:peptidase M22 [Oscillospiraceae bacterium]